MQRTLLVAALLCTTVNAFELIKGIEFSDVEAQLALDAVNTGSFSTLALTYRLKGRLAIDVMRERPFESLRDLSLMRGVTPRVLEILRVKAAARCPAAPTTRNPSADVSHTLVEALQDNCIWCEDGYEFMFVDVQCSSECFLEMKFLRPGHEEEDRPSTLLCPLTGASPDRLIRRRDPAFTRPVERAVDVCVDRIKSGDKLTPQQNSTAITALDNICGDTFCGGDFNFFPRNLVCPVSGDTCTLEMGVIAYFPESSPNYATERTLLCILDGLNSADKIVTPTGYADPLYNAVLDNCTDPFYNGKAFVRQPAVPEEGSLDARILKAANEASFRALFVEMNVSLNKIKNIVAARPICSIDQLWEVRGMNDRVFERLQSFAEFYY